MGNLRPFIAADSKAENWSAAAKLLENAMLEVPGFLVGGVNSSACAHYQLADEVVGNLLDFFRSVLARFRESILTAEPDLPHAARSSRSSCTFFDHYDACAIGC